MKTLILLILSIASIAAHADDYETGYVDECHDGDTCKVYVGSASKKITVRLAGVDAPEVDQDYGDRAQIELESLVLGKTVQLDCSGRSYQRYTCRMLLDGEDIGKTMIANGWAFELVFFTHGDYREAQRLAQSERRGLWGLDFVQSPVCFREKNREQCRKNPHFGIEE